MSKKHENEKKPIHKPSEHDIKHDKGVYKGERHYTELNEGYQPTRNIISKPPGSGNNDDSGAGSGGDSNDSE